MSLWHRVTFLLSNTNVHSFCTLPYSVLKNTNFSCPTVFLSYKIHQNISILHQKIRQIFVKDLLLNDLLNVVLSRHYLINNNWFFYYCRYFSSTCPGILFLLYHYHSIPLKLRLHCPNSYRMIRYTCLAGVEWKLWIMDTFFNRHWKLRFWY